MGSGAFGLVLVSVEECISNLNKHELQQLGIREMCEHVQAGARWRSFDEARRQRFIGRVVEHLMEPRVTAEIRRIWVGYWSRCDPALGRGIAMALQEASAL
jgi:catalase